MLQRCLQPGAASARVRAYIWETQECACVCVRVCTRTHLWPGCFCPCTSRSKTQIRSLKKMLVRGECGSPGPQQGKKPAPSHSHTDGWTHARTHTGSLTHMRARQTERNDSEPHGPAVRSRATVCSSVDGCGGETRSVWSRGLPGVCERRAAAARERGGGGDGGGGMEERRGGEERGGV